MLLDNKGKLFGKISIVDILVVIIIVGVIGGLYYKFGKSSTVTPFTKTDTVQVTYYHEDVPNYIVDNISIGDIVKDRVQNVDLGKVVNRIKGSDISFNADSNGVVVVSQKPGYSSITVTSEGKGIYSSAGVTFGGVEYFINKQIELRVGKTVYYAKISDIKKVEE